MRYEDVNLEKYGNGKENGKEENGMTLAEFQEENKKKEKELEEYYKSLRFSRNDVGKEFEVVKIYKNESKKFKNKDGTPKHYYVVEVVGDNGEIKRKIMNKTEREEWAKASGSVGILKEKETTKGIEYLFVPKN